MLPLPWEACCWKYRYRAFTTQCNEKIRGCVTKSLLSNSSKRREAASESKMLAWDTRGRSKARDASNFRVLHLIKWKQEITGFCNPASANGSNKIVEIEKTRKVIDKMSIDYDWKMTGDPRWMVEAAKFLRATTWHDSKSKRVSCVCMSVGVKLFCGFSEFGVCVCVCVCV